MRHPPGSRWPGCAAPDAGHVFVIGHAGQGAEIPAIGRKLLTQTPVSGSVIVPAGLDFGAGLMAMSSSFTWTCSSSDRRAKTDRGRTGPRWKSPQGAAWQAADIVMAWHVPVLLRCAHAGPRQPDQRRPSGAARPSVRQSGWPGSVPAQLPTPVYRSLPIIGRPLARGRIQARARPYTGSCSASTWCRSEMESSRWASWCGRPRSMRSVERFTGRRLPSWDSRNRRRSRFVSAEIVSPAGRVAFHQGRASGACRATTRRRVRLCAAACGGHHVSPNSAAAEDSTGGTRPGERCAS